MCLSKCEKNSTDNLNRPLHSDELYNTLWNNKCDYIEVKNYTNLNPDNYNLLVMQLNIQSILSHQLELKQLLRTLEKKNS